MILTKDDIIPDSQSNGHLEEPGEKEVVINQIESSLFHLEEFKEAVLKSTTIAEAAFTFGYLYPNLKITLESILDYLQNDRQTR